MSCMRWVGWGATCFVALACATKAPGVERSSTPPRASEAEGIPSVTTTTSAPSSAAPEGRSPPRARLQDIVVESGEIDAEVLKRIVRQRVPELRDCYVPRSKERPQLAGQLHFRLRLASNGDVSNVAAVVDTLGDAETHACVKAIIQSLVLPSPDKAPALIVVPLQFAPN